MDEERGAFYRDDHFVASPVTQHNQKCFKAEIWQRIEHIGKKLTVCAQESTDVRCKNEIQVAHLADELLECLRALQKPRETFSVSAFQTPALSPLARDATRPLSRLPALNFTDVNGLELEQGEGECCLLSFDHLLHTSNDTPPTTRNDAYDTRRNEGKTLVHTHQLVPGNSNNNNNNNNGSIQDTIDNSLLLPAFLDFNPPVSREKRGMPPPLLPATLIEQAYLEPLHNGTAGLYQSNRCLQPFPFFPSPPSPEGTYPSTCPTGGFSSTSMSVTATAYSASSPKGNEDASLPILPSTVPPDPILLDNSATTVSVATTHAPPNTPEGHIPGGKVGIVDVEQKTNLLLAKVRSSDSESSPHSSKGDVGARNNSINWTFNSSTGRPRQRKRGRTPSDNTNMFCFHCGNTETPEWRRGPAGPKTLCNACGLQYSKKLKQANQRQKNEAPLSLILNSSAEKSAAGDSGDPDYPQRAEEV